MRSGGLATIAFFAVSATAFAQTLPVKNAGFEEKDGKGWAVGWVQGQHAGEVAYRFALDEEKPFEGRASARIEQYAPQVYGHFKQRIDVRQYVGKRVKVSAQLRAKEVKKSGGSGLYVRVDGVSNNILRNDFTSGATHGTHDWKPFAVVVDLPPGAIELEMGIILQDFGTIWADGFNVQVTNDPVSKVEPKPKNGLITFERWAPDPNDDRVRNPGKKTP